MSPSVYRRFVQPSMKRIFAAMKETGSPSIHFGTGTAALLEVMTEAGKERLHTMSTFQQFKSETEGVKNVATQPRLLAIPPNFFAITMGLAGLAGVWRLAGDLYHLPASIGDALYVVTAGVFLLLIVAFAMKLVLTPKAVMA
ncbi:MAG: uroporphyrinogen decarboxylase family protein, partial [Ktedonobacteraceae bacterium]